MLRRWMLHSFQRVYKIDGKFRRRFTGPGYLILAGLVAAAIIGTHIQANLASQMFAFLGVLMLLSALSSVWFRPRLHVQRILPPFITATEPAHYHLRVENLSLRHQRGLCITDELENAFPSVDEFRLWHDPQDQRRNRFDRYVGYPKWVGLVRHKRGAHSPSSDLPIIPARGSVDIKLKLTPQRRGYLHFQEFTIARPDPLGIFKAIHRCSAPASLLVLPKRYPIAAYPLSGARLYQPGGVTLGTLRGDAEEFIALRDYRPGDSLRHIHWKSWAKAGKPIVREYRPEYFTRHALILDTCLAPAGEVAFEEAVSVAASFVCTLKTQESLLDLMFVGSQTYRFSSGHGRGDSASLLKILACVQGIYTQSFAGLQQAVMACAGQFSACILVLLTWDEARRQLWQALRARGIQTLVIVVATDARTQEQGIVLAPGRIIDGLRQAGLV